MNISELLCCTCTIAMHLFLGHSVYKPVLYWVRCGFSKKKKSCHVSWYCPCTRTISTLVLSVLVLEGTLTEGGMDNSSCLISHPLHYRIISPLDKSLSSSRLFHWQYVCPAWLSSSATEEITHLFTPDVRSCFTLSPALCLQAENLLCRKKWSYQFWLHISWKPLIQVLFKCFALFTLASDCAVGSCPVNAGTLTPKNWHVRKRQHACG